jgi:uncharacterized protein YdhG (YjbR/CyaY superfamily)
MSTKPDNIDEYITGFPEETQKILEQVRATIKKVAPHAIEVISYGMPAFKLNGILVWFAAHTKHLGFYPKASGIEVFKEELSAFKCSKGAIQFPFGQPLPLELITKIVEFRVIENLQKEEIKRNKKKVPK